MGKSFPCTFPLVLAVGDLKGKMIDGNDVAGRLFTPAGKFFSQILQHYFHVLMLPSVRRGGHYERFSFVSEHYSGFVRVLQEEVWK